MEVKVPNFVRVAIENEDHEFLMTFEKRYDLWNFIGGEICDSENSRESALRNVNEKTGMDLQSLIPVDTKSIPCGGRILKFHYFYGTTDMRKMNMQRSIRTSFFNTDTINRNPRNFDTNVAEIIRKCLTQQSTLTL